MRSRFRSFAVRRYRVAQTMRSLAILLALLGGSIARAQVMPGSMDVRWDEGAADCAKSSRPPLQVHAYNAQTYILRENLCATFEAPFMYLLIGKTRALLIDTGDVADAAKMPLAETVLKLLPGDGSVKLPLLVVHTHRHLDHRAGDVQFVHLPNVEVVGFDIGSVKQYYKFSDWPNGTVQIDLGERTVDVMPTPGHNETEVTFYDRNTGLLFTGDFLLPARFLIDDAKAEVASAERLAAFVKDRPVAHVLGGHIEMNAKGELYDWESPYHPNERALQMTKEDVLALPGIVRGFNGFYTKTGTFVMMDSIRILIVFAVVVLALLVCLIVFTVRYFRRRRARKRAAVQS